MPATGGLLRLYPLSAKNVSIPSPALFAPFSPPKSLSVSEMKVAYLHCLPSLKNTMPEKNFEKSPLWETADFAETALG